MHLGNWQLDTVNGGRFCLDGGVIFGVVPKTLWSNLVTPDPSNRVQLANHCVLARDGQQTVLIDTGYGDRYSLLDRKFYQMESGSPLLASLAELDVSAEEIDTVIFSHLHFDHVCGALVYDKQQQLVPTFPNARYVIGQAEWQDATSDSTEMRAIYPQKDILALKDQVHLSLVDDRSPIVPGIWCRVTGGHTRGHLALILKSGGQTALYPGDLCPSTFHLRQMWHLGYDLYPLDTRRRKPRLLGEAADNEWWVLWNHDPTTAVSQVQRDRSREFVAVDAQAKL